MALIAVEQPRRLADEYLQAMFIAVRQFIDVSLAQIETALAQVSGGSEQRLAGLQQRLRCGTNCGSCLPELQRLARRSAPT